MDEVKLDQIKVFLQFNKLVLNVVVMVKLSAIHVDNVEEMGKTQTKESVSVKIPKGVDDGTRIRVSGKGEAGSKGRSDG